MKTTFLMTIIILSLFSCKPPKPVVNTHDAQFIFRGTVQQLQAANLPEIKDTQNTIIVKVDEVVFAPIGFTDWTGKLITVAISDPNTSKPEQKKLFYTNGWLYGESIAVIEVGDGKSSNLTNDDVRAGAQKHRDDKVRERLKRAELVVSGKLIEIKPLEEKRIDSEHEPEWALATIEVSTALKGNSTQNNIKFLFPTSRDVMWAGSPKFDEGGEGIWLLTRSKTQDGQFTITQKEDFFEINDLKRIETLLKK